MSLKVLRKWLGAYMIFGSLTGIYACLDSYQEMAQRPSILWIVFVFGFLFSLIGAIGISLLNSSKYVILAMLLQAIQVVGFSLGYKYVFTAGASIKLGYEASELLFVFEPINSEFLVGKDTPQEFFYINVIPVTIILLLNQLLLSRQKLNQNTVTL